MKRLGQRAVWFALVTITVVLIGRAELANADAKLPYTMDIFTTAEFPIRRIGFIADTSRERITKLTVYRVDGLEELEQLLSENLRNDPDRAQAIALERMQTDGARIRQLAQEGADALELAIRYGIDRYPAMVFNDGESVIYGITNVEEAVAIYLRERRRL